MPAGGRLPPAAGPVIAMVGRSNVGKSSLINALIRRGLARAGAKPGTTRLVHLYAVRVVFEQAALHAASSRGRGAPRLAGVILLVDGRHPGLASDVAAQAWLAEQGHESIVVTTKNDRMSRSAQARARRGHEAALGRPVFPVSSRTGA
ncbi:MAG: hypothetical protein F4Y14_05305, partial [Acidobacteria bacterium]|nr:hypothetical protein [Acidobacteriota bacterium]